MLVLSAILCSEIIVSSDILIARTESTPPSTKRAKKVALPPLIIKKNRAPQKDAMTKKFRYFANLMVKNLVIPMSPSNVIMKLALPLPCSSILNL